MSGILGSLEGLMQGGGTAGGAGNLLSEAFQSAGGVSGIVSKFQQAGMGDKAQSWVGSGGNMSLAAEEVTKVFPPQQIEAWAAQHGIPAGAAAGVLAHLLPHAVDSQTPTGQMGGQGGMTQGGMTQGGSSYGDDPFADGRAADAPDTDSYNDTQARATGPGQAGASQGGGGQGFDFGGLVQRLMGGNR